MFFSQYWNLVLFVDRAYEFISGMIILFLTYWTYVYMDVSFR